MRALRRPGYAWPAPGTALVALDLEMNCVVSGRARILQYGVFGVDAQHRQVSLSAVVDGETDIGKDPARLRGTTDGERRRARPLRAHTDALYRVLHGAVVVMHNASHDWTALNAEFRRVGAEAPRPRCTVCTLELARYRLSFGALRAQSNQLGHLCQAFGIPLAVAHNALHDARATFWLLLAMATARPRFFARPPLTHLHLRGLLHHRSPYWLPADARLWPQLKRIIAGCGDLAQAADAQVASQTVAAAGWHAALEALTFEPARSRRPCRAAETV